MLNLRYFSDFLEKYFRFCNRLIEIFARRWAVYNFICDNFLFPLGWLACGVNPIPRALHNFNIRDLTIVKGTRKWYIYPLAYDTTQNQMIRVAAHNNNLFALYLHCTFTRLTWFILRTIAEITLLMCLKKVIVFILL